MRRAARNSVLALASLGLSTVLAFSAFARDDVPRGPVEEGYAITVKTLSAKGKAPPPPWRPPHRDKLMSKGLAALFARDDLYQDESGEMGQIGADPQRVDVRAGRSPAPRRGAERRGAVRQDRGALVVGPVVQDVLGT